jgi:hypothetical protein
MRKLIFMLVTTPMAFHSTAAFNQEGETRKKPLIDLPDNQLQLKMKALENRIQAQKDQLEKLSNAAKSPEPLECPEPPPAPKCPAVVTAQAVKPSSEVEDLRRELAAKDAELKKKTREVVFLKNALAQASAAKPASSAAAPTPEPAAQPAPAVQPPTETAELFESRISFQFGYGPNGTQEKPVGDTGAVSVVTKYSAVFGLTYERQITPSWSFGVTALSNKTVLGAVGYGVAW